MTSAIERPSKDHNGFDNMVVAGNIVKRGFHRRERGKELSEEMKGK